MSKLKKKMCKLADDGLKKKEKEIMEQVLHPRYICKKCLRVAMDEELLCNPKKME